jgi:heme/copper-type cytochrome/quinol oxidase subunit 2
MKAWIAIAVFMGVMTLLVYMVVSQLDAATALQCRTNDWPESQAFEHLMWCLDNGYPSS